jgi:hypothetical protein
MNTSIVKRFSFADGTLIAVVRDLRPRLPCVQRTQNKLIQVRARRSYALLPYVHSKTNNNLG